ncbi:BAG domain-containing protein [Favolaschia claudopus]|uniref:BAG domain-containing protein n=1 Tax=Favolaschia claudopus TaxID=2862362 RepID=A0AAW0EI46_9AGAR
MFHNHSYYPSPTGYSYRTPASPVANPREKYLAALAEAKAAEAEYLAAERLQQEEDELRQRLDQIQHMKHQHQPAPAVDPYYPRYPQASAPLDIDALRRQIAAEERARIVREQELEAIRVKEAQRKAQEAEARGRALEALRIKKAHQAAHDLERSRALAAQRAHLEAVARRAAAQPTVRFVVSEPAEPPRQQQLVRPRQGSMYPEFPNTVDVTPLLAAASGNRHHHHHHGVHGCGCERKEELKAASTDIENVLSQLFGGARVEAKQQRKHKKAQAPAAPEAVSLEQLFQHMFSPIAPQPKAESKPAAEAARPETEAPVTLEQLLSHFLGAAGVEVAKPEAPATKATHPAASAPSTEKKEAASAPTPAPAQVATAPAPKPAPTPAAQPSQPVGLEHVLNQFLGAAGAQPSAPHAVDLQQLFNMFLGGAAPTPASAQPQVRKRVPLILCRRADGTCYILKAGPSNSKSAAPSASTTTQSAPATKKTALEEREERELAEAIRMSLADSAESKGKSPAPAPVKDVASSTAEVQAIDASFGALSNDFALPSQLDFSTSRTSSPVRSISSANSNTTEESVISRLSFSTQNQPVRFYHQALSGLLAKLDAVESFGDEELRHRRKEVVGKVEGALDEVERVVEARWRKWAGRDRESVAAPASEPALASDASEPVVVDSLPSPVVEEKEEEAPVIVEAVPAAEESVAVEAVAAEPVAAEGSIPVTVAIEAEPESSPASYPPASEPSSYPPSAAESVATLRPTDASPAPAALADTDLTASPAPSDIDTFLLPAASEPEVQKKPRATDSDVGSDWSEVDA